MDKTVQLVKKIIYPPVLVRIPTIIIGFCSLIPVFGFSISQPVFVYAAYVLSAYALVLFVAWLCQKGRALKDVRQYLIRRNGIAARYISDRYFQVFIGLVFSLTVNLAYAVLKAVSAILTSSGWTGLIAAYYIALCMVRFYLMTRLLHEKEHCIECEIPYYRRTAGFLLLINLALSVLIYKIVEEGETYTYPEYVILVYAGYTFYSFGSSIHHMRKFRRYRSPLLSAVKIVGFTTALVSVLSLQTAMLTQFGTEHDFSHQLANAITGTVVCAVILALSVFMLVRSHKMGKRIPADKGM